MVKRVDLYSVLVSNGFKAPQNNSVMFFKGYAYYFFKNVMDVSDKDVWEKIGTYTDDEWRKLYSRLQSNGHMLD